jgi:hypothetical protein
MRHDARVLARTSRDEARPTCGNSSLGHDPPALDLESEVVHRCSPSRRRSSDEDDILHERLAQRYQQGAALIMDMCQIV